MGLFWQNRGEGRLGETPAPFFMAAIPAIGKTEYRTMPYPKLGCLERVGLETRCDGEPSGFAPWFLDPDRLGMLGDALGLRLEPVLGALTAGPDCAGLVCRDAGADSAVAVESQLGESGDAHLGALLVRVAECRAAAAVWVAERFAEQHRAALECLNRPGGGSAVLFGVEMGLWRIGDSRPALRFDVAAAPYRWPGPGPLSQTGPRRGRYPCRVIGR